MLFGVFDGHGGKEVAVFTEAHYKDCLLKLDSFKKGDYRSALTKSFLDLDAKVQKEDYANDTGTTSCVVLVTPDEIWCANAGDSRGVLSKKGQVVELSHDHKPDNEGEIARIKKANHFVDESRVDGNLALSRAFGDFQYKDQTQLTAEQQAVTCNPDIINVKRTPGDEFIMLACDGIWDCLTNEECIQKLA